MIYLIVYLAIGFGFALASWLQAQEKRVRNKQTITLNLKMWLVFILLWWGVALYCYRAEVKRTIPTIDYFDKGDKND